MIFITRLAPVDQLEEGIVNPSGNRGINHRPPFGGFETAMSAHPSAEVKKLPSVWLFAS